MDKVIAHAPSKLNLVLEVEPLRPSDNKHLIQSVFCTTALADTLVFEFVSGTEPFNAQVEIKSLDYDTSFIKAGNNSLIQTVEHFKREYGFGFLPTGTLKVELIKSIPTQAGLGGGSSDAAAMLRMLCWLAQVEPTSERSLKVARAVGADVPFFLYAPKTGLCALMNQHGDELERVLPKPELSLALVQAKTGVSSAKAYAMFDELRAMEDAAQKLGTAGGAADAAQKLGATEGAADAAQKMVALLEQGGSAAEIAAQCANDLFPAAKELVPEISKLKEELCEQEGVLGASLTGSGSVLFAVCTDASSAQKCVQHFANKGYWALATQS